MVSVKREDGTFQQSAVLEMEEDGQLATSTPAADKVLVGKRTMEPSSSDDSAVQGERDANAAWKAKLKAQMTTTVEKPVSSSFIGQSHVDANTV